MTNHKASLIVGHVFHLAEILPCSNGGSLVATPQCNNNEGRYYSRGRSSVPPKILLMNMNSSVVPVTSVKFKSAFLHDY